MRKTTICHRVPLSIRVQTILEIIPYTKGTIIDPVISETYLYVGSGMSIDDGSTDETTAVTHGYGQQASSLFVVITDLFNDLKKVNGITLGLNKEMSLLQNTVEERIIVYE